MGRWMRIFYVAFALWVVANAISLVLDLRQYDPWRAISTEVREDQ